MSLAKPATFEGLRSSTVLRPAHTFKAAPLANRSRRASVATQASFLGSPENLIVVGSTTAFLAAGRFGLAPSVKKSATAGLKLVEDPAAAGLKTGDPAGFTAVDVLGLGALGHAFAVGVILGLRGIGSL